MKTYPQKPPLTDDELKTFLDAAPIARLGSMNPDGTIHIAALWFKYDNGDILFGTQDMTNKVRNIKRDPSVTVLIDIEGPPLKGVLIYGHAELDYEDVVAKRIAIFEKYMPSENAQELATMMATSFAPVIVRPFPLDTNPRRIDMLVAAAHAHPAERARHACAGRDGLGGEIPS